MRWLPPLSLADVPIIPDFLNVITADMEKAGHLTGFETFGIESVYS